MDWCRVVGPRGLCRPLDEKQRFPTRNSLLTPCKGRSKFPVTAGVATARLEVNLSLKEALEPRLLGGVLGGLGGPGSQDPLGLICRPPPPKSDQSLVNGGVYCLTAEKSGRRHYSPRIWGGFALPHHSDETLGRGLRSEPRAPMQMVGGILDSLGFRVWGLGFVVWGAGFGV